MLTSSPVRGRLRVPAISETGYHRLLIDDREIVLAVAPSRCHTIDDAVPDARLWGIAAQVYSLRHHGDGGIGDAAGIAALADAAGSRGADALALSPLHALFGADPSRFGPYSPSTRLFLNPLHASAGAGVRRGARGRHVACRRAERNVRATGGAVADRLAGGGACQVSAAAGAVRTLRQTGRWTRCGWTSHSFRADGGELLTQHAVFETLHAEQSAAGCRRLASTGRRICATRAVAAVAVFAASHEREVLFHCFLQWLADRSLAIAQSRRVGVGYAHRPDRRSCRRHGPERQPRVEPAV